MKTLVLTPAMLAERAARVREIQDRANPADFTRPARDPDKRAALKAIDGIGPYREGESPRPTQMPARRK
jgi:predicted flap endonuclease-1-like 5' DNA nuclease